MSFPRYPEYCSNREYHFAGAGKMIAVGKECMPKMELDEKDAGVLLGDKNKLANQLNSLVSG